MTRQYPLELPTKPSWRREDFIASECNRAALAFVESWPEWPDMGLILHGADACGKTHLAAIWRERAKAVELAPERIGSVPSDALLGGHRHAVLEQGDEVTDEAAFFHLLHHIRAQEGTLLLTSRRAPAQWSHALPDLRSRLLALPACAIDAPDETLLASAMRKQFADRQLAVPDEVLTYVLARMERSFAAAGALVAALDRAALAQQRAITLPLARKVLEESASLA